MVIIFLPFDLMNPAPKTVNNSVVFFVCGGWLIRDVFLQNYSFSCKFNYDNKLRVKEIRSNFQTRLPLSYTKSRRVCYTWHEWLQTIAHTDQTLFNTSRLPHTYIHSHMYKPPPHNVICSPQITLGSIFLISLSSYQLSLPLSYVCIFFLCCFFNLSFIDV